MEPKLNLTRDQLASINEKRAIPHGGLKLVCWLILFCLSIPAAWAVDARLAEGWLWVHSLGIAVFAAWVIFILVVEVCRRWTKNRSWPFPWLARYIDSNVRGWWLIYARCHDHDVYALALKSPTGEIRWIVPLVRNLFPRETCIYTNFLFIPLGGWGNRPFIYSGAASQLVHHPDTHTYEDYQWQVRISHEDPICEWTRVCLTDTDGSRVKLRVWDALTIANEVIVSCGEKWISQHTMRFLRERDEARKAACDLLGDLMTAERAVFATRRFVRSKQGLGLRVSLLLAIQQRLRELDQLGIRTRGHAESRDLYEELSKAQKSLAALDATN